jgi:hypothetical protein
LGYTSFRSTSLSLSNEKNNITKPSTKPTTGGLSQQGRPNNSSTQDNSTLSIAVLDERGHEKILHFKTPSREKWLASANRFLKPEPPSWRVVEVYERLLKTCAVSAGLSKRSLEQLPIPSLEYLYQQLWIAATKAQCSAKTTITTNVSKKDPKKSANTEEKLDQILSFFLLEQELAEFRLEIIVREDIRAMGERGAGTMHSYYPGMQEQLNGKELSTFLQEHECPTHLFNSLISNTDTSNNTVHKAYWASRRLESAIGKLPWALLFDNLTPEELHKYPRLGRLKAILEQIKTEKILSTFDFSDSPSFLKAQNQLQSYLYSNNLHRIAEEYQQARPLRLLVLVEGETEIRLFPLLANALGHNLDALGVHLLPSGGKNYMSSLYKSWSEVLNVPICMVLDDDASNICDDLESELRPVDKIFRFTEGEFEDTYNLDLLIETINRVYQPFPALDKDSFKSIIGTSQPNRRVSDLKTIWNHYQLGSFDKVAFAQRYAESLSLKHSKKFISPSIQKLFNLMMSILPSH